MARDPFLIAQQMQAQRTGDAASPEQNAQQPNLSQLTQGSAGPAQSPNGDLIAQMKALDINPDNIPMNAVGRQLLALKLQNRWGKDYMQKNDAKDLMSSFDSYISQNPSEQDSIHQLLSQGKRTLGALNG